jgi:type I restriction enzyme S subunit
MSARTETIERLKNRVRFAYGDALPEAQRNAGDVAVYGSNGIVGWHDRAITGGPTIIIGRKGSFGKVSWSDSSCFPIDTAYFVDRGQTKENLRWLSYALESLQLDTVNFDSAVPGLSREAAYSLRLRFPPKDEQMRIAAFLDGSCAAIDKAIEAKRKQIETLDELRRSQIQQAVTRGIGTDPKMRKTNNTWMKEIPYNWGLVALKRVSSVQTGLTLGKEYDGPLTERPYLRVANVQDGHLDLHDVSTIEVPENVARGVELQVEDVLMTEGGDLDKLGRGFLWMGEIPSCLHQNHIFALRCYKHKLLPKFLAYLTASRYGRDYFEATGKRTTNLASTNSTKVGRFPIPLPAIQEQDVICQWLDEKSSEIKLLQGAIARQIETLTAYRSSLVHECVTGKRRITDEDVRQVA